MTTPAPCPLPFDAILRARLVALITDVHGRTLSGLGAAMGHARTWLTRKLGDDQAQPKPTTLADCTEVLLFLGEPPGRLFAPVLVADDDELLARVAANDLNLLLDAEQPGPQVQRLLAQGLVVLAGANMQITDMGAAYRTSRAA